MTILHVLLREEFNELYEVFAREIDAICDDRDYHANRITVLEKENIKLKKEISNLTNMVKTLLEK